MFISLAFVAMLLATNQFYWVIRDLPINDKITQHAAYTDGTVVSYSKNGSTGRFTYWDPQISVTFRTANNDQYTVKCIKIAHDWKPNVGDKVGVVYNVTQPSMLYIEGHDPDLVRLHTERGIFFAVLAVVSLLYARSARKRARTSRKPKAVLQRTKENAD